MVHEAMVLEYSGRHLAMIDLAAFLKLSLYVSLIWCLFCPFGIAQGDWAQGDWRKPAGRRPTGAKRLAGRVYSVGDGDLPRETGCWRRASRRVGGDDRQNASVPRAELSRCGIMLGLWACCCCSYRRHVMHGFPTISPTCWRDPGAAQLPDAVPDAPGAVAQCAGSACLRPGAVGAWQANIQHAPHLYITAAIALVFKAIIVPVRCAASSSAWAFIAKSRRLSALV